MGVKREESLSHNWVANMTKNIIIDRQTGTQIGKPYTDKKRARSRANKLDLQYGAYRYTVKTVEVA